MAEPSTCPSCFSVNKPDAARCRVCGRKLKDPARAARAARPVLLERVMSGEVFTAVIGGDGRRVRKDAQGRDGREPRDAERRSESRDSLEEVVRMFRTKAVTDGERFEPYAPPKRRRRRKGRGDDRPAERLAAAMDAMRERRFAEAAEALEVALESDDEDLRAWILLGEARLLLGERYAAASAFHRALSLDSADDRGWVGIAKALRSVREIPAALESLDRALALNPSSSEAWTERGEVLESLSNLSEALRSFAKALEHRPDYAAALRGRKAVEARLLDHARERGLAPTLEAAEPEASRASADAPPEVAAAAESVLEVLAAPTDASPEDADLDAILGLDDAGPPAEPEPAPEAAAEAAPAEVPAPLGRPAESPLRARRLRTYVDGLDEALDGGIPEGHVVLLQGPPGTMKSSIGFSILLQNAVREGRHGLYLTLEERAESLLRQMASLGMPLTVDRGSLVFLDPRSAKELLSERQDWIPGLQRALEAIRSEKGIDLLVIDSLEALEVLAKFKDRRREIYRLFEWLRDLGVTSFVITERPDWVISGHVLQGRWDEDFLADGVVQLRLHSVTDIDVQRRLRVMKMRGTRHEAGYLAFVLDETGFRVTRAISP